jgi:hypothetical protein
MHPSGEPENHHILIFPAFLAMLAPLVAHRKPEAPMPSSPSAPRTRTGPALTALLCLLCLTALPRCKGEGEDGPDPMQDTPDLAPPAAMSDEIPLKISARCPGPGCEDTGDGKLYVGAASFDLTPAVETFTDSNKNDLWDPGEPFEDRNGNNKFDEYWLSGYGNGRLAFGFHDPIWARALALRKNKTTVVLVAVDALGLFREETKEIEKLLDKDLGVNLLLVHATHCHQTPDTVGAWGRTEAQFGVNDGYITRLRRGVATAVAAAVRSMKPARVTFGSIAVEDGPMHDMKRYVSDARDPVIIDNVLRTMQFSTVDDKGAARTVATLINWAHHPESAGSRNHEISSDYVHYVRERVEARVGGVALYVSGALGGQIGPGKVQPVDDQGRVITQKGFEMAEAIGKSVARFALTAMADPKAVTLEGDKVDLSFRTTVFNAEIANLRFIYGSMLKIYRRPFCCYDQTRPLSDDNHPFVETAVSYLRLGPAAIITNPGELHPELFIGGYQGEYAGTYAFLDKTKANAADLSKAPQPPYLIDVMDGTRAFRQTWGLTHDFLGYIVPRFNFVLHEKMPYLEEADGDHYEETNSIGPLAEPQVLGTMRQLVLDGRPNTSR